MTSCAFLHTNLAAGLTPTATSTSAAASYPWTNLNDPQPRIRARVTAASLILVFDLGSAQSVDCAALLSTSLPAAATARLRASTADPTVVGTLLYDSGVQSTVTSPDYNGNIVACFTSVSARYWRWDLASGTNPIDIGLAPLGLLYRPSLNMQFGMQEGLIDLSKRDMNQDTGAEFGISGPKKRTKLLSFMGLTSAEIRDTFGTIDRNVGASGDVLFVFAPDETWINRSRDSVWGGYRQVGPDLATQPELDRWARNVRMTERL